MTDTQSLREDLHNSLDELINNLVAGQAGVEPLLYPNQEDYVMRIEALFESYTNSKIAEELVDLKDFVIEAFHPNSQGYGLMLPEIDDRIDSLGRDSNV